MYIFTFYPSFFPLFVDVSLKPIVQFPKSLLNLTDSSNVTSIEAYLTIPRLPSEEDNFMNTWGIMSTKSGSNTFFIIAFVSHQNVLCNTFKQSIIILVPLFIWNVLCIALIFFSCATI